MSHRMKHPLSRRNFLKTLGTAALGLAAGCKPSPTPFETPTPKPKATPTQSNDPRTKVAIAHAASYEPKVIHDRVRTLLDSIGGLSDIISAGDRVAIKTNLTGGLDIKPLDGWAPIDSYVTHPEVVRALGGFVRDAGAKEVFIVEAVYEWGSYTQWGYEKVAKDIGATLINLNDTAPYTDFAAAPVPQEHFVYQEFVFNHLLQEIDAFISVSKMKCHYCCGVTHTLKNLIGLVPARFYTLAPGQNYRSAFHGNNDQMPSRLPGVILDLNRSRPIHLGLIDGIKTTDGGEGPWIQTLSAVQANVLLAGKDPVATDAVATAVMGFDPTTDAPNPPFLRAQNHLNIACDLGLGTNKLEEIKVIGPSIQDVQTKFEPCWDAT